MRKQYKFDQAITYLKQCLNQSSLHKVDLEIWSYPLIFYAVL